MTDACKHMSFEANTVINRLEDTGRFMADITIKCTDCGKPFQFLGLEMGLKMNGATVSPDGLEARLAIAPEGLHLSPMAQMMHGRERADG